MKISADEDWRQADWPKELERRRRTEADEVKDFNPHQPRIPAGKPGGGRWGVVEAILGVPGRTTPTDRYWGKGMKSLFPDDRLVTTAPWANAGRSKLNQDYDPDVVREALTHPPITQLIDPRGLRDSQPGLTRAGVDYYVNHDQYEKAGTTFADRESVGNKLPFIYRREDGQDIILTGHHRAAAALVKGEPLRAIVVEGPWGPPRKGQR